MFGRRAHHGEAPFVAVVERVLERKGPKIDGKTGMHQMGLPPSSLNFAGDCFYALFCGSFAGGYREVGVRAVGLSFRMAHVVFAGLRVAMQVQWRLLQVLKS